MEGIDAPEGVGYEKNVSDVFEALEHGSIVTRETITAVVFKKDFLVVFNMLSDISKAFARRRMPVDVHDIHWLFPNSAVGERETCTFGTRKRYCKKTAAC